MSGTVKERFQRAWSEVERAHRSGMDPRAVADLLTERSDAILKDLFAAAVPSRHGGIALVAIGGYGRGQLAPASDLDVLLLHRGPDAATVTEINNAVMYPLWDAGREVGNRTRDLTESVRSLVELEEATALIDARLLAGDEQLFAELQASVLATLRSRRASFLRELHEATIERHATHGHLGHLLEPDIREASGGLRDVHCLRWASAVYPAGPGLTALSDAGVLSPDEVSEVERAYASLLRWRIESHLLHGRREDRLVLERQDELAERLGYADSGRRVAGDAAMQELYRTARALGALVVGAWEEIGHRRGRRRWRSSVRTLGDGCVIRDGGLQVVAVTEPHEDASGWLRAFRHSLRSDVPIRRSSLRRLEATMGSGAEARWSPEALDVFGDILRWGRPSVTVLETMDRCGLLPALFPAWDAIRCLPQRDLYHRYTVDMHLFHAVAELAESHRLPDADVRDAWERVGDDTALCVAALLHDVGKGRGTDHTEAGTELAREAAERMGLGAADTDDLVFAVREHLSLASLATHRDTRDERTLGEMAQRAGTPRRLAMLYLLTRADSLATGPEAWSPFRAALVRELYAGTMRVLSGEAPEPGSMLTAGLEPAPGDGVRLAVRRGEHGDELVVAAPDRPGLFATVCGVLALRGIDVQAAEVATRPDGTAVELFRVRGLHGPVPDERWTRVRDDITAALLGTFDVDEALRKKAAHTRGPKLRPRPPQIRFDDAATDRSTVIEVRTTDRLGVLRLIAKTLADSGCDVRLAKVATYGAEIVDVFYVTNLDGHRIEPDHRGTVDRALVAALGSDGSGG